MVQIPTGQRQFYDTATKTSTVGTYTNALARPVSQIGQTIDALESVKIMGKIADAKEQIKLKNDELRNVYSADPENAGFQHDLESYTKSVYSEMRQSINPIYRGVFDAQTQQLNKSINQSNEYWKFKQNGINLQNDMQKISESLILDAYENGQNMDYQSAIVNFENNVAALIPAANKYLGSENTNKAIEKMREAYLYQFAQGAIESNPDQVEELLNNNDFRKQAGAENIMKLKNTLKNYKEKLYKQQQTQALREAKNSMKALKELQRQAIRDERKRQKELEAEEREKNKEGLEKGKETLRELREKMNLEKANQKELEKEEKELLKQEKADSLQRGKDALQELRENENVRKAEEREAQSVSKGENGYKSISRNETADLKQKKHSDWVQFNKDKGRSPTKSEQNFYDTWGYYPTDIEEEFKSVNGRYPTQEEYDFFSENGRFPTKEEIDAKKNIGYFPNEKQLADYLEKKEEKEYEERFSSIPVEEDAEDAKKLVLDSIDNLKEYDNKNPEKWLKEMSFCIETLIKQSNLYSENGIQGALKDSDVEKYASDIIDIFQDKEKVNVKKQFDFLFDEGFVDIPLPVPTGKYEKELREQRNFLGIQASPFNYINPFFGSIVNTFATPLDEEEIQKRLSEYRKEKSKKIISGDFRDREKEAQSIIKNSRLEIIGKIAKGENPYEVLKQARQKINYTMYPEMIGKKVGDIVSFFGVNCILESMPDYGEPTFKILTSEEGDNGFYKR